MKENKDSFIIVRVTKKEKEEKVKEANGNLSTYIRKLIGLDK